MDVQFEKDGKQLVAVDAGWKDNGYSVFEVQTPDGKFLDTVLVHPLDEVENTLSAWVKG